MKQPPKISEIRNWLIAKNPLGAFRRKKFIIKDIDPKPWSGHFNYLIDAGEKKFVLRFKGPEWGEPTRGVIDEFKVLKKVERYNVGPKVYYLDTDFFGEPMILEECLDGRIFTSFPFSRQDKIFSMAARFIAKINKIPIDKKSFPFRKPATSYQVHKESWRKRLKIILRDRRTKKWGQKVMKLLPRANKMLDRFESLLKYVLKRHGPAFIFESAHAGHLMKVRQNLRFLNWEQVSYGDPAYTLSVFLASISRHQDFERIKDKMIKAYLEKNPVADFRALIEQRLSEREVSNLIWILWAYVQKNDTRSVEKATDVLERFKRVRKILK